MVFLSWAGGTVSRKQTIRIIMRRLEQRQLEVCYYSLKQGICTNYFPIDWSTVSTTDIESSSLILLLRTQAPSQAAQQ